MRHLLFFTVLCCCVLSISAQDNTPSPSPFVGTTLSVRLTSGSGATLRVSSDGLGFYSVSTATTVKANTAYMNEARTLLIDLSSLDNPLVGIKDIGVQTEPTLGNNGRKSGKWYDLAGRRQPKAKMQNGIYVTQGKKVATKNK